MRRNRVHTTRLPAAALLILGLLALPGHLDAAVFSPSFTGPALDSGLVESGSAGTSASVGGGTLSLDQAPGLGNGLVSVSTAAQVSGDFVATVTASGVGLGRADVGLMLGTADFSSTLADVFLNDNSQTVNGNIFVPNFKGAAQPKTVETVTLTIERSGNTVTDLYDAGAGPVLINSGTDAALGAPMNLSLFLLSAVNDQAAHHGAFIHFSLATGADAVVPEPASAALIACGLLALWTVRARRPVKRLVTSPG